MRKTKCWELDFMTFCIYIYIYIYIERERKKDRETGKLCKQEQQSRQK